MAVTSVTDQRPERLRRLRVALRRLAFVVLGVLVIAALAVLGVLAFDRFYEGRVLPGVTVAGVNAAGLTADELRSRLADVSTTPDAIQITTGHRRMTVPSDELGRQIDVDGAVALALSAGRQGGALADVPLRFQLWQDGLEIPLEASVDRAVLTGWVADRAADLHTSPRNAEIVATATGWAPSTPMNGEALDQGAAIRAIEAAMLGTGDVGHVDLALKTVLPDIDTFDIALSIAEADRMTAPLTVNFRDDATWTLPTATLRAAIKFEAGPGRPVAVLDSSILAGSLTQISEDVARDPDETILLKTKGGNVFGFVPGKNGRTVDVAATAGMIADLVEARRAGLAPVDAPSPVVLSVIPPNLTAEEASTSSRQMTLVGAWTTKFTSSERNGFGNNITIPARLINGTVVAPGQVFDFWGAVGPVTFDRGFRMGGIIEGGRTNPTGAIGGGICSASTTLFNAAARAGFQILEREQHAYYIPRYPLGLDATVSKYGGRIAQNMRFRNDTGNPIFIRGMAGSGWVRFEIYSLPNGRTVTFSKPSVTNVRKAIDQTFRTGDLPRGKSERTEVPANGMDVVVIRTVRNAAGAVIHSDRFVSHYIRVNGILMIGTG